MDASKRAWIDCLTMIFCPFLGHVLVDSRPVNHAVHAFGKVKYDITISRNLRICHWGGRKHVEIKTGLVLRGQTTWMKQVNRWSRQAAERSISIVFILPAFPKSMYIRHGGCISFDGGSYER